MGVPLSHPISVAAQLQHVRMSFDGYVSLALADVNLEIRRGEILGVIGPQGSGKSITLMLLAGRLRPMEGKVKVFGRSPHRSAIRARIGYLPQRSRPPSRSGLFSLLWRMIRKFRRAAEPATPAIPNNLRLAQLLLKKPDIVVLDEPFAGLETTAALEMMDQIRALAREGKTVVLSDRSLSPAKDLCNRMAILFRGQLQAVGSLDELLAAPDAIRVLGPVLPPRNAERVLATMREEMLGHSNLPTQSADDVDATTKSPKPQSHSPDSENRASQVLTALTQPSKAEAVAGIRDEPIVAVNHEKLAQFIKPGPAKVNQS